MALRAETYAPDRPVPYLVQRTYAQTLQCPIRSTGSGALVVVSSGTVTVIDPAGTTLVDAAAVTITSSIATYVLTLVAASTLGDGYQVIWALTIAAEVYTFQLRALCVEYVPPNCVTAADLYGGEGLAELRHYVPQAQRPTTEGGDGTGWAPQIDAAYYALIRRMLADGRPIWLSQEPTGYREWLLSRAIKNAVETIPAPEGSSWARERTEAYHRHKRAEAELKLSYSSDDVGVRRGASPVYRLCPVGRSSW